MNGAALRAAPAAPAASMNDQAGLLMAQVARLLTPAPARAELVASAGEFVALTADGGTDDLLAVVDQRAEAMLIYQVKNQNALELRGRLDLRRVFVEGRRAAGQ